MATADVIEALTGLFEASDTPRWPTPGVFEITLTRQVSFRLLRRLEAGNLFARFVAADQQREFDRNAEGNAGVGSVLRFEPSRSANDVVVVPDLKTLLAIPESQTREPAGYAVTSLGASGHAFIQAGGAGSDKAPASIRNYQCALRLWRVLKGQAQHEDDTRGALLFFGIRRTEILPGFEESDLTQPIQVDEIEAFVSDPDRKDTRKEIFAAVLSEFLRDVNPGAAFQTLVRNTARFARQLREGMAIYLSEHSPEKLAEEAKAAVLGLSEKLEKVVSNLETKSLSIPLAVFLAVKEVAPGEGFTIVNSVVLVSGLIYAVTMTLVHFSQLSILQVLRTSIDNAVSEFQRKGLAQNNPVLSVTYGGLGSRVTWAKRGSYIMCFVSWVPVIFIMGVVLLASPAAKANKGGPAPNQTHATASIGRR